MRASIYNPYLDTLGGGERYSLAVAKVLAEEGCLVDIEWKDKDIYQKLESRFGEKINKNIHFVEDIKRGDGYDFCFWVSDGSIPTLLSRKNILHFQVPFQRVGGNSLLNKMKLFRVDTIVCNSEFTKKFIDDEYGVESEVVYPPVDTIHIRPKKKENIILFVGRFSELMQSKGQELLIKEFKRFYDKGNKDWRLVLAGGVEVGSDDFLSNLEKKIKDYPIEIKKSPSFLELKELYGHSKIYWSAAGYDIDENNNPEKVEHFGITLVESMSAGCVPIVSSIGGHKEIISNGVNGFLWTKTSELQKITKMITENKGQLREISKVAQLESEKFSYEKFRANFIEKI